MIQSFLPLHRDAIKKAYADGVEVILTCDNGIAAHDEIKKAKELGMTVMVTDHYEIPFRDDGGEKYYIVPEADAVVDPKQEDCHYPNKKICGTVVAMQFVRSIYRKVGWLEELDQMPIIEFATLVTVCDVTPLQHKNRIIIKEGIKRIQKTKNLGRQALLPVWELNEKELTSYDIGFRLGPTINVAGSFSGMYYPGINEWSGHKSLQIIIREIQ